MLPSVYFAGRGSFLKKTTSTNVIGRGTETHHMQNAKYGSPTLAREKLYATDYINIPSLNSTFTTHNTYSSAVLRTGLDGTRHCTSSLLQSENIVKLHTVSMARRKTPVCHRQTPRRDRAITA